MSLAVTSYRDATKKVGRPKKSERNDRVTKIDATVLGWCELIARAKGISVAEYISEVVRPVAAKDYGTIMRNMAPPEADQ